MTNDTIIIDPALQTFFRKPHSKKRRILKKWKKRQENWKPDLNIYAIEGGASIMHPIMAKMFKEARQKVEDSIIAQMAIPSDVSLWTNNSTASEMNAGRMWGVRK